jgi:hypothetical protein
MFCVHTVCACAVALSSPTVSRVNLGPAGPVSGGAAPHSFMGGTKIRVAEYPIIILCGTPPILHISGRFAGQLPDRSKHRVEMYFRVKILVLVLVLVLRSKPR